jgi:hypothetical protein
VELELYFSDPYADPDPTFHLISDPTRTFSDILNINFTFIFRSCKCFRFYIMRKR